MPVFRFRLVVGRGEQAEEQERDDARRQQRRGRRRRRHHSARSRGELKVGGHRSMSRCAFAFLS